MWYDGVTIVIITIVVVVVVVVVVVGSEISGCVFGGLGGG